MKIRSGLAAFAISLGVLAPNAVSAAEPIKIGVLSDMSGVFSDFSGPGSVVAAQMAAEEFKDLGPIEILRADHLNKSDVGAAIARQWFDVDKVDIVADTIGSAVGLAVAAVVREKGKIAIFSGAGANDLFGVACSKGGFVWAFNAYSNARVIASALMDQGYKSWYLISQQSAWGRATEETMLEVLNGRDARVAGVVRIPIVNEDYTSFLTTAQASHADVIAIFGGIVANQVKQATEFGVRQGGQQLTNPMIWEQQIYGAGLNSAQGMYVAAPSYWDLDDGTRAWSKEFAKRAGYMPSMTHMGTYSGVRHFLQAVRKTGSRDPAVVIEEMRRTPVEDATAHGTIRPDGLLSRDYYLFQVKSPAESRQPWDIYKVVKKISAADAMPPLKGSACPLVHD